MPDLLSYRRFQHSNLIDSNLIVSLIQDMVFLFIMVGVMATELLMLLLLPLHLLHLRKHLLLQMSEKNVKLRLKLILNLGIMDTTDMDMVDTMDQVMADTMVDTTDILDMDMLTTDKQIKTQTSILKDEKNDCHQTKLNQKTAAT